MIIQPLIHLLDKEPPQSIGLNSSVEAVLKDGNSMKINSGGVANGQQLLEDLNRHSDFISHRLLINFYNYPNSKEINLWEVFCRDIFPFLLEDSGNGPKTLSQLLKELYTTQPYKRNSTTRRYSVTKSTNRQTQFNTQVSSFNDEVNYWLTELNNEASTFYNTFFKRNEELALRITLEYSEPLNFLKGRDQYYEKDGINYSRWSTEVGFNEPVIRLKIEEISPTGEFTEIRKPQSHLNEAKLTQIALSIRFSLLSDNIRPIFDGKILVLDDLLVSLDMANRDRVVDIILNEFAPEYKVYLFTHERSFFNMIKDRIYAEYNIEDWIIKEIYAPNKDDKKPIIRDTGTNLARASFHFKAKDYPASVNYLRKELEDVLEVNLPSKVRKSDNGENLKTLAAQRDSGIEFVEYLSLTSIKLKRRSQYLKIMLNPLSHNSSNTEAYEVDISNIIAALEDLKPFLEEVKRPTNELHPRKGKLIMTFQESSTLVQEFEIEIQKELYECSHSGNTILTNCLVKSLRSRSIENSIEGDWGKNEHYTNDSLEDFYKAVCTRKGTTPEADFLKYFKRENGTQLS